MILILRCIIPYSYLLIIIMALPWQELELYMHAHCAIPRHFEIYVNMKYTDNEIPNISVVSFTLRYVSETQGEFRLLHGDAQLAHHRPVGDGRLERQYHPIYNEFNTLDELVDMVKMGKPYDMYSSVVVKPTIVNTALSCMETYQIKHETINDVFDDIAYQFNEMYKNMNLDVCPLFK